MGQEPNHIAIARLGLVLIHMELRNLMDLRRRSIVFYSHFFRNFTLGNPTYTLQEPSWQDKSLPPDFQAPCHGFFFLHLYNVLVKCVVQPSPILSLEGHIV